MRKGKLIYRHGLVDYTTVLKTEETLLNNRNALTLQALIESDPMRMVKRYVRTFGLSAAIVLVMTLGGVYLFQMNKRGGFESIPETTPVPSLRIARERNVLQNQGASFSFAVLGDMRWSVGPRNAILKDAQERGPLFMANLGDPVEFGRADEWGRYINELVNDWNRALPYFHTPGGHSLNFRINGIYPAFYEHYFGRTYYFVDVQNWRFIFLDTSKTYLPYSQAKWLSTSLEECKREGKRAVIFTHCPPRAAEQGITHSLTQGSTDALARIISGHDVTAIFAGHIHDTFGYKWRGIPVYITSLNGKTWNGPEPTEYLFITVKGEKFAVETISLIRRNVNSE